MKILIAVLLVGMLVSPVFAEGDRIAELQSEATAIRAELQKVQEYSTQKQIRLIEIQGAIKELTPKEPKVEE